MSEEPTVLSELDDDGVLLVTLNRPRKKNAFNEAQWDALAAVLDATKEDPRVAVIVLTGAGGNFSSGADLSSFSEPRIPRTDGKPSAFFACVDSLFECDRPVIAAVAGVAVGGGCTIAIGSCLALVKRWMTEDTMPPMRVSDSSAASASSGTERKRYRRNR